MTCLPLKKRRRESYSHDWLDALPEDVCTSVAHHLLEDGKDLHWLQYASMSNKQRRAVVNAYGGKYYDSFETHNMWRKIFLRSGIVEVEAYSGMYPISRDIIALLKEPTLRKVTISNHPDFLTAVSGSSVTDMTVILQYSMDPQVLLGVFQTLNLKKLLIRCKELSNCCLGWEHGPSLRPETIAAVCPNLHADSIETVCQCGKWNRLRQLRWIVSFYPRVTICRPPPQDSVKWFSTLKSVNVLVPGLDGNGNLLGQQFPAVVVELNVHQSRLTAEQVEKFPAFTNLKVLQLRLQMGGEVPLLNVCRNSPCLLSLQLSWCNPDDDDEFIVYEDVVPGSLVRLVEAAPELEEILLCGARISTTEVKAIMRCMGTRLKVLGVPLHFQEEDESDRLLTTLEMAIEHNYNLRILRMVCEDNFSDVDCRDLRNHVLIIPLLIAAESEVARIARNLLQVMALLSRLRMRQPQFRFYDH